MNDRPKCPKCWSEKWRRWLKRKGHTNNHGPACDETKCPCEKVGGLSERITTEEHLHVACMECGYESWEWCYDDPRRTEA